MNPTSDKAFKMTPTGCIQENNTDAETSASGEKRKRSTHENLNSSVIREIFANLEANLSSSGDFDSFVPDMLRTEKDSSEKRKGSTDEDQHLNSAIHETFANLQSFGDFESFVAHVFGTKTGHVVKDHVTTQEVHRLADMEDAGVHPNRWEAEKKMSEALIYNTTHDEKFREKAEKFNELIESFINILSLIQFRGNEQSLDWNSSVLDSIMGVFLTQNVSDVLSGSAFMSLRSKYPAAKDPESIRQYPSSTNRKTKRTEEEKLSEEEEKKLRKVRRRKRAYWGKIRRECTQTEPRPIMRKNSVDWNAVRMATEEDIAEAIKDRGQQKNLAERIQSLLENTYEIFHDLDLEWLRNASDRIVKEFLSQIHGIGTKSIECVSLLELSHPAFPVDANVNHVATRLEWIFLQPLSIEFHQLQKFPPPNDTQEYLWPYVRMLDQEKLLQLHYLVITFGKVFCTKQNPNCKACPFKDRCKYFASSSAHRSEDNPSSSKSKSKSKSKSNDDSDDDIQVQVAQGEHELIASLLKNCDRLRWEKTMELIYGGSIPPHEKMNVISKYRAIHNAYVLEDDHPLLAKFQKRVDDDPCHYLLVIPIPTGNQKKIQDKDLRGTIMIPSRTAVNKNFPLKGTYFQSNEVFADEITGKSPVTVRREDLEGLERVPLYCASTTASIYKGMSLLEIQYCFWKGKVCSRGFNRQTGAPTAIPQRFQAKKKDIPNTFQDWYDYDHRKL